MSAARKQKIKNGSKLKSSEFINKVMHKLHSYDRAKTYSTIRAILIALRNRLTTTEIAYVGNRLPPFLRTAFYDGWIPSAIPFSHNENDNFLEAVMSELSNEERYCPNLEDAVEEVCRLLVEFIGTEELGPIESNLPIDMTRFMGTEDAQQRWEFNRLRQPLPSANFLS